jgi:hypothetical protein
MLSPELLKEQIGNYDSGKLSLGQFEDWFYDVSEDPIQDSYLSGLVDEVDSALSARHFAGLQQDALRRKLRGLANAARPLASRIDTRIAVVVYQPPRHSFAATAAAAIVLSAAPPMGMISFPASNGVQKTIVGGDPSGDAASANSSDSVPFESAAVA